MTEKLINRHSGGTIVAGRTMGGKFAEKRREEAAARALSGFTEKDEQDIADSLRLTARTVNAAWMNHTAVLNSREDIRQEAVIDIMSVVKKQNQLAEERGEDPVPFVQRHGGLVRTILNSKVMLVYNQGHRHEGGNGRKRLARVKREMESSLGRELSPKEFEDLADGIRMEYPPGSRPPIGYQHNTPTERSNHVIFDDTVEDELLNQFAPSISMHDPDPFADLEPEGENSAVLWNSVELMQQPKDSAAHLSPKDAKLEVWDILRDSGSGVPAIVPLRESAAKSTRHFMGKSDGDAHGVAQRFLTGMSTRAEDEALFAPFGGWSKLSMEQRDVVAEKIARNPSARGTKLWRAALDASRSRS